MTFSLLHLVNFISQPYFFNSTFFHGFVLISTKHLLKYLFENMNYMINKTMLTLFIRGYIKYRNSSNQKGEYSIHSYLSTSLILLLLHTINILRLQKCITRPFILCKASRIDFLFLIQEVTKFYARDYFNYKTRLWSNNGLSSHYSHSVVVCVQC